MRMDKEGKLSSSGSTKSKKTRSANLSRKHQYEEPPQEIMPPSGSPPQMYEAVPDESITSNGASRTEQAFSYTGLGTVHEEGGAHNNQENGDDHMGLSVGNGNSIGRSNSAHQRLQQQNPQTPHNDSRPQGEYDNPWEWTAKARAMGGADGPVEVRETKRTRSKSDATPRGRSSPESDTRPQEDYDQPWEWIKKNRNLSQVVTGMCPSCKLEVLCSNLGFWHQSCKTGGPMFKSGLRK